MVEYDLIMMSLVIFMPAAFAVFLMFFPRGSEKVTCAGGRYSVRRSRWC